MDLEKIIELWESSGLLGGIDNPERRLNMSLTYERTAQILINSPYSDGTNNFITTAIFPSIYRIMKRGYNIKNIPDFIEKFKQFIDDNMWVIQDLHGADFDAEAELCYMFTEDYLQWIIDNPEMDPIRYVPKHKL